MLKAIIGAALALAASTGAQASSIFTENFNSSAFRGSYLQNDVTDRFGTSVLYYAADANGWTFSNGPAGSFPYVLMAYNTAQTNGSVWLQEIGSSATRTITGLTAGKTYNVSFLQSGDNVFGSAWTYNVKVDGGTIYNGAGVTQAPGTNSGQFVATKFVANGTSAVLSFADSSSRDGGNVVIDNISVTGVPEAATWAMMIAGFSFAGFASRRRRNRAVSVSA